MTYLQFNPTRRPIDPARFVEVFWSRVRRDPETGCWDWQATKTVLGYGRIRKDGKEQYAHRISWELTNGPIPDDMVVCHRCDNPPCCNPDHLFLGSKAENTADMVRKHRATQGTRQPLAKLTDEQVEEIRTIYAAGGVMHKELAERYGVSKGTISRAVRGEQWTHVGGPITVRFRKTAHMATPIKSSVT